MIYSKRHAKSVHLVGYKGIVTEGPSYITCPYIPKFFDLSIVADPLETVAKLKAIGIDPKFMLFDEGGFSLENFERELAELQEDMPEDE